MSIRARAHSLLVTITAAVTATIAVTGGAVAVAPAAAAAPSGNIVTFGDSFTANPDQLRNTLRMVPAMTDGYPQTGGCLQAPNNWPRQLGARTGAPLADWSCAGNTSRSMLGRIDRAIAAGDVHRGTRSVVLAAGMNNYGGFGVLDGVNILDPGAVRNAYLSDMRAAASKIRAVAPGAKIVVSGALPTVDRDSMVFCALNVVPNLPAGVPVPVLRDVENWNRANQRDAARQIGGHYVEMIDGARGHDTCAPDRQRYVAGVIDTTTPNYNMIFHPSYAGSQFMASQLAREA
ncbi:GDSL-type esterase/lipase family protein [Corynebacteriaceae bacterium 7-707]